MTSANIELVRSIFEPWERGDFGSVEWAHPEIEFVVADGLAPGGGVGLGAMGEAWRELLSAWEELRTVPEEFRELDGDRVLVLTTNTGRGKTSGLELGDIRTTGANLFHLSEGKVTRLVIYFDRKRALSDLGPSSSG